MTRRNNLLVHTNTPIKFSSQHILTSVSSDVNAEVRHDTLLDIELANKLEQLRKALNYSKIIVNSGYRCYAHDKRADNNGYGQHTKGTAVSPTWQRSNHLRRDSVNRSK